MRAAVIFLALVAATFATKGVDVSQQTLEDAWKCLKGDGYSFGVIRCFESIGRADENCPHTIYNAWDGGADHVDIYMFPDPTGASPSSQVGAMLDYLAKYKIHSHGTKPASYGTVWLDIEGTQYWHSSTSENVAFFNGLVDALAAHAQIIGVYTSKSQWEPIMGSSTAGSRHPLWYAHYDGNPSFSDFEAFGGWTRPSIKQYGGDKSICGAGVDVNWYPGATASDKADADATKITNLPDGRYLVHYANNNTVMRFPSPQDEHHNHHHHNHNHKKVDTVEMKLVV
eukprot:m.264614 g.264614  ORF g.264614 m.264614 type:complete len:284 (-) comp28033_c0_seq1:44-895(-)